MDRDQFLAVLDRVEAYLTSLDETILSIVRDHPGVDLETVWRTVCERMHKQLEFRGLIMVDAHLRQLAVEARIFRVAPDRYAWIALAT
jgi:hypothetical protein